MKMNLFLCLALLPLVGAARETPAPSVRCERIYRTPRETPGLTNLSPIQAIDDAAWIWIDASEAHATPLFVRFRLPFQSDGTAFDLDVSADERFALTIDGQLVLRGPHRGLVDHWNYQSYRIRASKGPHVIEATVSQLGSVRPSTAESLYDGDGRKNRRDTCEGLRFCDTSADLANLPPRVGELYPRDADGLPVL